MDFLMKEVALAVSMLTQQGADLPEDQLLCMTRSIYHEARGEDILGQIAVAYVKTNRVDDRRYPNSVCGVVTEDRGPAAHDCQFSWYCDGLSDMPTDWSAYQDAMMVAILVMDERVENPVPNATHYYAPAKARPYWADLITEVAVIDGHRFMEE